jgi:hypothetical protein
MSGKASDEWYDSMTDDPILAEKLKVYTEASGKQWHQSK